jgi:hypothetical protein
MKLRLLVTGAFTLVGFAAVVACESTDNSTFGSEPDAGQDSGDVPPCLTCDAGSDGGGDGALARSCTPAIPSDFKPSWKAPAASQKKCDSTQIENYYKACLAGAWASVACQSFLKSATDAECAKCLDTQETDAAPGPIVWRLDHGYFNVNIPGCVALVQGDTSDNGCGAAYEKWLGCDRAACTACFQKGDPDSQYQKLIACQSQAGSVGICDTLGQDRGNKCGNLTAADAGTQLCLPGTGETLHDVYTRTAALFCNK